MPVPISGAFANRYTVAVANRYTVAVALTTCSHLNIDSAPPHAASRAATDFCPLAQTKATAYAGADACADADAAAVARADAETDARDNPTAAIATNGSANALAQRRR
jgi:hypothetical protein